jgi:transcriptional regulator with GAF, ATPase, and Fis domain
VWRQLILDNGPAVAEEVLAHIASAGVQSRELTADGLAGTGLVIFDRLTPRLFDLLHGAGRSGLRVLAVSLDPQRLPAANSWGLLAAGAADVISWHHHRDPAAGIAARFERWAAVDEIVDSPLVRDNLVGRSPAWIATLRRVVEVARFTDAPVLVLGETGTGKELVARLIHTLDARPRRRDLVIQDCAAIVPQLAGSEFFGHDRGAFTDAVTARDGCFALADGGTLFLDEISELPLNLQAELLRAVQERTYKRVGSNTWHTSQFRLLCASNRDLLEEVERGAFRRDLYYRIASTVIRLPPLRDRAADIVPLAQSFLAQLHPGRDALELDEPVREYLLTRTYDGNVRDLRQLVHRIDGRHVGPGPITVGDIPADERPLPEGEPPDWRDAAFEAAIRRAVTRGVPLRDIGHAATEVAIDVALGAEGSVQRAARQLKVTDRALQLRRAARRDRLGVWKEPGSPTGTEA